jgi:hypothetical protein
VFADEDTAKQYVADMRDGIDRCPEQHRGRERWVEVRTPRAPRVPGFDQLLLEQGRQVSAEDGTRADRVYVLLTARADANVLTSSAGGPADDLTEIREQAVRGLRKMRQRLVRRSDTYAVNTARSALRGGAPGRDRPR